MHAPLSDAISSHTYRRQDKTAAATRSNTNNLVSKNVLNICITMYTDSQAKFGTGLINSPISASALWSPHVLWRHICTSLNCLLPEKETKVAYSVYVLVLFFLTTNLYI